MNAAASLVPAGYLAKTVSRRPAWLQAQRVADVYSVSPCLSGNFADYIPYWRHNGYWLFDSPAVIRRLAEEHALDLRGTSLFYYDVFPLEFDDSRSAWRHFQPEPSFGTPVVIPRRPVLEGYDVVTFSAGTSPECSPLSCNGLAGAVKTNRHCLLTSLEEAQRLLEGGGFAHTEPGPFRVFAVHSLEWPKNSLP